MDDEREEFEGEEPSELTEKETERRHRESAFRRGCAHGASWLRAESRRMVGTNSASEVSERLGVLMEVLTDWRNGKVEMPAGNPWEWSRLDLEEFIEARRGQW